MGPFGTAIGSPKGTAVPPMGPPTVMLLNNGMLLEGAISSSHTPGREEGYVVKTDLGSMLIPQSNVDRLGHDKLELYQYRKSRTTSESWQELIGLAEWAQRYGLKEQGIEEYRQALAVAPNDQIARWIRERIAESEEESKSPPSPTDAVSLTNNGLSNANDTGNTGSEEEKVLEELENEMLAESLGVWAAKVPKKVIDTFTKKVQPVLLSRCAAAECHGSLSESEYVLANPKQHGEGATLRNLQATFRYIDPHEPASSLLLTVPARIHGGSKPLNTRSSRYQFNAMSEWVESVVATPLVHRNRLLREPTGSTMLDDPNETAGQVIQAARSVIQTSEEVASAPAVAGEATMHTDTPRPIRQVHTTVPQPTPLTDALDPDVFNRMHHAPGE